MNATTKFTDGIHSTKTITINFAAKEFACQDPNDTKADFYIDTTGVGLLQKMRTKLGIALSVNSAYRTKIYNTSVGGSSTSKHLTGHAFDMSFSTSTYSLYLFAKMAEVMGFKGIILYASSKFVHVDTRDSQYFYLNDSSTKKTTWLTTVKYGSSGQDVKDLQTALNKFAGYSLTVDGAFGAATQTAVKAYQTKNSLSVDGIVGANTWKKLLS